MNIFSLLTASVTVLLFSLLLAVVEMENNLGTLFLSRIAAINFEESSIPLLPSAAVAATVLFGALLLLLVIIWSRLPK